MMIYITFPPLKSPLTKKNIVLPTCVLTGLVNDLKIEIIDKFYVEKVTFYTNPKIQFLF